MRRFLLTSLLLTLPALSGAALLPDTIGAWQRGNVTSPAAVPAIAGDKVWQEYGLHESETAEYTDAGKKLSLTVYRFSDATGAYAAFEASRPADAKQIHIEAPGLETDLAADTAKDQIIAAANYLMVWTGYKPKPEEINHILATVPRLARSPLPDLPRFMPPGALANSQRYILGPDSLGKFVPGLTASTVGFQFNAEGQIAAYGSPAKPTLLALFTYPTMEMARDRYAAFQQTAGVVAKRSGPLVAVILHAASDDAAQRLLAQVKYEAQITVNERPPTPKDNPGNLFLNIIILCLVLAGFCVASGLIVGGLRVMLKRSGASGDGDDMISLHLSGR